MVNTKDISRSFWHSIKRNGWSSTVFILYNYLAIQLSSQDRHAFYFSKIGRQVFLRPGHSDFSVFRQIFMNGEYDIPLPIKPKIIIDAGANIGLASLLFNFNYPDAIIFALEPDPTNLKLLKHQTRAYKQIKIFPYALWNSRTNLSLISEGYDAWGIRVSDNEVNNALSVKGIDLTTFMQENSIHEIDLLKIDVEGAEKEIFSVNFEYWLKRTRILVIELHENIQAGTEMIFYNAIRSINHRIERSGENIVVFNMDLL
jgi:FkbM family methyltransferase